MSMTLLNYRGVLMTNSRTKNATRNIIFALLNKFVSLALPFVTRTIITYILGAKVLGLSSLFTSVLSFLSLAELGLGTAIVHSMYKPIAEDDKTTICALLGYYKKMYRTIGMIILGTGTLVLPVLPYLIKGSTPEGINIYIVFYIYLLNTVLSYFLAGYKQCLLTAHQRSDITSKISIVANFVMQVAQIIILCITKNYYVYAFLPIFSTLTINILNAKITSKMFPDYKCGTGLSKEVQFEIRKKINGLIGTKINAVVVHSSDALVVSAFLGLIDNAKYANYFYVVNTVSGLMIILYSSMTAGVGNSIVTENLEKNYTLFKKLSFINSWIVNWCCVCLICLYHPFMQLWMGESMVYPVNVEACFVLYFFIYNIQRVILMFKDAAGLWYEDRMRPYVSMSVNVILNIILVQKIGVYGIILSSILAFLVSVPWANYTLFTKLFRISPWKNIFEMFKSGLIACMASVVTYTICNVLLEGAIFFLVKAVICVLVPNTIFYLFYRKCEEFSEMCIFLNEKALKKIKHRR